jgi:hypothetical protein
MSFSRGCTVQRALLLVGAFFLAQNSAVAACDRDDNVYATEFKTDDSEWDAGETAHFGEDHLELTPAQNSNQMMLYQGDFFDRAQLCTDVELVTKEGDVFAGLIFWAVDYGHLYQFEINPKSGEFFVGKRVNDRSAFPVVKRHSDAIHIGSNQVNEIKVILDNESATFLINAKEVGKITGWNWLEGNKVGLLGESEEKNSTIWRFNDFVIKRVTVNNPSASK